MKLIKDFEDEAPAVTDDKVTKYLNLDWVEEDCLPDPTNKMKDTPGGLFKGREKNFRSPVVSLMSTLPLVLWKVSFRESNRFAHQEMEKAQTRGKTENNMCGAKWKDITLGDFMVFFGILLKMCLFPLPWHSYVLCWAHGAIIFPFVNKMQVCSFQQIRSVLHFNDNETIPLNDNALQKVRPLVNIVKVTLCAFIRVGSELALDEASVASRSSYGCALILFNPTKNCGKFHFQLYVLCCATTYACVRMQVATKNNSDSPYPHKSMATLYKTALLSKLNKLVMEMCKPLFGSKRTVHIDNFYTLPAVLMLLLNQKVFARGTAIKNRRMVSECIIYTKTEAEKAGRGALKCTVNLLAGIYAFGWSDGNPVHMLSTAEGSDQVTTVSWNIGKDERDVPAPKTVKAYNAYMQGVDRHDQLWETFAILDRFLHNFLVFLLTHHGLYHLGAISVITKVTAFRSIMARYI
jgi:hypothetical protein